MLCKFKKLKNPIETDDAIREIFQGGLISALIKDEKQKEKLINARTLLEDFLIQAESNGILISEK